MIKIMRSWLAVGRNNAEFRAPLFFMLDDDALRKVADGPGAGRAAQARLLNARQPIALTPENIRNNALPKFQAWANGDVRIAAVGYCSI